MSRKHFQALADELASNKPTEEGPAMVQWRRDCIGIARACRGMNGRFDQGRFLSACGYEEPTE